MNLGQTMITAGVLLLLIMSAISANQLLVDNAVTMVEAEAYAESAMTANDLLQEVMSKKFDEYADATGTQDTTVFSIPVIDTKSPGWGPSGKSENVKLPDTSSLGNFSSIAKYDDADDYDGYYRFVKSNNLDGLYKDSVRVYYVFAATPTVPTHTRTYYKAIEVSVTHPVYLKTPLKVSGVMSY